MFDACRQLLIATTPAFGMFQGVMTPFFRNQSGVWCEAWPSFPIVLGKNGMAWDEETLRALGQEKAPLKQEGDGCSPIGCFPLLQGFGSACNPSIRMPYHPIQGLE